MYPNLKLQNRSHATRYAFLCFSIFGQQPTTLHCTTRLKVAVFFNIFLLIGKLFHLTLNWKGQLFSWKLFLRANIYCLSKFNLNLHHVFLIVWIEMKSCQSAYFFVIFFSRSLGRLKIKRTQSIKKLGISYKMSVVIHYLYRI